MNTKWRSHLLRWWPLERDPTTEEEGCFVAGFHAGERHWGSDFAVGEAKAVIEQVKPDKDVAMVMVKVAGYDALSVEELEGLDAALKDKMGSEELLTVFLGPSESIEMLSEQDMLERGWRRA